MNQTAASSARAVRSGHRTAVDVVGESLERIANTSGAINAFVEVRGSEALDRAALIDARVAAGEDPGPLAGVPVAVKDSMWEHGRDATAGSRALLGFDPPATAAVVERLVDAGAVVVGRTNLPEFCYRGHCANDLYGTTSNPIDPSRTPGGSSGGSAAAVASGVVPIALGSDGGGSIRIPASFCGIVGFKPTYGRVPRMPGFPGWYTLNHFGPLTGTVGDAALAFEVIAGPDGRDATSIPRGDDVRSRLEPRDLSDLRIGFSEDLGYVPMDDEVRQAFRLAVKRFASWGAEVVEVTPDLGNPLETWNTLAFADNVASEGHLLEGGLVGTDTRTLIDAGVEISGAEYARARNEQNQIAASWEAILTGVDLLLTPTMECVAFPHGRTAPASIGGREVVGPDDDWCHFSYPFDLSGQPAISVPMPSAGTSLPMGLQLVGRRFDDSFILDVAAEWERRVAWERPQVATTSMPVDSAAAQRLTEALAAGRSSVTWDTDAPHIAAGQCIDAGGSTLRVLRSYAPRPGTRTIEFEDAPG